MATIDGLERNFRQDAEYIERLMKKYSENGFMERITNELGGDPSGIRDVLTALSEVKYALEEAYQFAHMGANATAEQGPDDFRGIGESDERGGGKFEKGQKVIALAGPHKGDVHVVMHDFKDGNYNIRPLVSNPRKIKYKLGAAKANASELKPAEESTTENTQVNESQEYSRLKKLAGL